MKKEGSFISQLEIHDQKFMVLTDQVSMMEPIPYFA